MTASQGKELKAPEEKTVFEEDLSPEEKARILKEKMLDSRTGKTGQTHLISCLYTVIVVFYFNGSVLMAG